MRLFQLHHRQYADRRGMSTVAAVATIAGIGVVFLTIFLFTLNGVKIKPAQTTKTPVQTQTQATKNDGTANDDEPPFIRLPESSVVFSNSAYKFVFAYPDGFGSLTENQQTGQSTVYKSESGLAVQKPVGSGTAFMNGRFGVFVYRKQDFKLLVRSPDSYVGPTETGNDITWKVVSPGSASDLRVGQAFPVKTVKSQTGVTVFNFTLNDNNTQWARWVFVSGDYYVIVSLPTVSKPSGQALTDSDTSAYQIIGNNIAKTIRTPKVITTSTN